MQKIKILAKDLYYMLLMFLFYYVFFCGLHSLVY